MIRSKSSPQNPVVLLSGAGVLFILMGLLALALPATKEGIYLWQFGADHTLHLMDLAGAFTTSLGIMLTWLGGMFWKRQLRT